MSKVQIVSGVDDVFMQAHQVGSTLRQEKRRKDAREFWAKYHKCTTWEQAKAVIAEYAEIKRE